MTGPRYTILVVDDEWSNLLMLKTLLQKHGYHVLTATTGGEGRAIAAGSRPDLIMLDVMMPDEDGYSVCRDLKKGAATAAIPVIFITALDDQKSKLKGLTVGGLDYITKPFMKEEVLMRARNILRLNYSFQRVIDEQAARLRQVRDAQQAILSRPGDLPAARFAVHYRPLLEAGGDFYDVFPISPGVHDYFVADVSGHDPGASLTTSALKALVRLNASQLLAPDETMRIINSVLHSLLSPGQHITAVYARLDRQAKRLVMVNAAHLPAIFLPAGGEPKLLEASSDTLGVFRDGVFESLEVPVVAEDRLFLFSDGLVESMALRRTREDGLAELLRVGARTRDLPLGSAMEGIVAAMVPRERAAEDDVVLLGVDI